MFFRSLFNGIHNTVTFWVTADIIHQNDKPLTKARTGKTSDGRMNREFTATCSELFDCRTTVSGISSKTHIILVRFV